MSPDFKPRLKRCAKGLQVLCVGTLHSDSSGEPLNVKNIAKLLVHVFKKISVLNKKLDMVLP